MVSGPLNMHSSGGFCVCTFYWQSSESNFTFFPNKNAQAERFALNYEIYLMNKHLKYNMEGKIYTHQGSTTNNEDFPNG